MLAHIQNRSNRRVLLKCLGDRRPSKIMRCELSDACLLPASLNNMPDMSGREWLTRSEVSAGKISLKNKSIFAARFGVLSIDPVGFEIIVNHLFDVER